MRLKILGSKNILGSKRCAACVVSLCQIDLEGNGGEIENDLVIAYMQHWGLVPAHLNESVVFAEENKTHTFVVIIDRASAVVISAGGAKVCVAVWPMEWSESTVFLAMRIP